MPKYSRYTKHSSGNDFLDLLNDTPSYSESNNLFENTSTPGSNTGGEWNFDFTFDIKKFLYWFVLFVIGYIVQPLVVYNILPTKIKNSPTKPVVPRKEIAPKQKTIKKTEKIGIFIHIPPKSLISFDFILSIKHPADKKSAADIIPWLII